MVVLTPLMNFPEMTGPSHFREVHCEENCAIGGNIFRQTGVTLSICFTESITPIESTNISIGQGCGHPEIGDRRRGVRFFAGIIAVAFTTAIITGKKNYKQDNQKKNFRNFFHGTSILLFSLSDTSLS